MNQSQKQIESTKGKCFCTKLRELTGESWCSKYSSGCLGAIIETDNTGKVVVSTACNVERARRKKLRVKWDEDE